MDIKRFLAVGSLFILATSCTCGTPMRVTSIQKSDKKLTCKDIILEINEAEHFRNEGQREKNIGVGEALMPTCWVTGYVDGGTAVKKANARIDYLGQIYDLMDCGGQDHKNVAPVQPIMVPVAPQPAPIIQAAPAVQPQPIDRGEPYYKLKKNLGPDEMHEHKDRNSRLYIHSHKHNGPHRHLEDER